MVSAGRLMDPARRPRALSRPFCGPEPFLQGTSRWRTSSFLELFAGRVGEKVEPRAASLSALNHCSLPASSHLQLSLTCLPASVGFPGTAGDHSVARNAQASRRPWPRSDSGLLAAAIWLKFMRGGKRFTMFWWLQTYWSFQEMLWASQTRHASAKWVGLYHFVLT